LRSVRPGSVDLLLANINAETLRSMAPDVAAALRPAGRVIVSGFPPRHRDRVNHVFGQAGLTILDENEKDGWVGITFAAPTFKR
jgi:ribosomal protein L11 methylase PrmA